MTREELNAKYPWIKDTELFQHANGGGWVQHPDKVDKTAYVEGLVYGNALVERTPWTICLGKHTITKADNDVICIGCHVDTLAGWLDKYEAVGRMEGYTSEEVARYGAALKMIEQLTTKP